MASSKVSPPVVSRFNSDRPTNARKGVIIFAVTLAILAYIDRVCISQAMPLISKDLGFTNTQVGAIFAAFGLAYAAFEVPGGWMGDWMGPRKVLMRIVIWWSVFTALTGAMWSFLSLWFTRFLFGAGEAGCFPNLTKAFSVWLPQHERVRAQGIMWTFARWGGAFTPPLVLFVLSYLSWRGAFVVFGLLGVIWAVWFYKWFRDNPKDHPSVNAAEWKMLEGLAENAERHGDVNASTLRKVGTAVILIVGTLAATSLIYPQQYSYIFVGMVLVGGTAAHLWGRKHRGTIWGEMLCSRSVWLLWVQYFLLSFPWYFYITWLPSYLKDQRPFSPLMQSAGASLGIDWLQASTNTANLAILPLFFGGCGSLACGLLSARVARWTGSVKTTRRMMASLGFFGAGSMLLLSIKIQDPLPAMIMMGFASFFNDLVMPGAWAACMDIGGRYAGTLAGSMNMMGNVAGFVAPMVGGRILDSTKQATGTADYNPFLYVMAVVYLLGTVVWPFIDPVTSIDRREAH